MLNSMIAYWSRGTHVDRSPVSVPIACALSFIQVVVKMVLSPFDHLTFVHQNYANLQISVYDLLVPMRDALSFWLNLRFLETDTEDSECVQCKRILSISWITVGIGNRLVLSLWMVLQCSSYICQSSFEYTYLYSASSSLSCTYYTTGLVLISPEKNTPKLVLFQTVEVRVDITFTDNIAFGLRFVNGS